MAEIDELTKKAESGDAEATPTPTPAYLQGEVVDKDKKLAFRWMEKAAEHGLVEAQSRLGHWYKDVFGTIGGQDYYKANLWLQKAADAGDISAKFSLGFSYFSGQGVSTDKKKTYQLWKEVADSESAESNEAKRLLAEKFPDGPPKGGCYVATCVYGSYDCPEVWTLRRYRDNTLSNSWFGRQFIRLYYASSPKIVRLFGKTKWFNNLLKPVLDKIVIKLQNNGVYSNPYSDI